MKRDFLLLFLIFALGIFLRVYNIDKTLLFHFDQGYHGLAIKEIWETKRLALLGHKTDVEGIFHGSTFYYFMLPIYLISSWDPVKVSSILAILDGVSIIFVFLIGKHLFNKEIGLMAALFYATSYSLVSYSRWLSNVTPIPLFSVVLFYFLLKSYQGNFAFFPLACFCVGFITQLNGAIGFFFLPLLALSFYFFREKLLVEKRNLLISGISFLFPTLPLIFFELRHNLLVSRSIFRLFFKEGNLGFNPQKLILSFVILKTEIVNLFSYGFPLVTLIVFVLASMAIWRSWSRKESEFNQVKRLLVCLLIPVLGLLLYQGGIHGFFFIGTLSLFILLISWGLWYWWQKKALRPVMTVLILFLFLINLYNWQGFLEPGFNLVPIGTGNLITLEDRKKAVDFIYDQADREPFKTIIYIIPYSQEQPWDYVFSWYGKTEYGFLPDENALQTFVIYEPDYDFPYRLDSWLGKIEEDHGEAISSFKAHDLIVEKRER